MVARLRRSFSDRRIVFVASLGVLSMFVLALIAFQTIYAGNSENLAMAWNLFLAWIPFVLALIIYDRGTSDASPTALGVAAVVLVLFFPQGPFGVTDPKDTDRFCRASGPHNIVPPSSAAGTG